MSIRLFLILLFSATIVAADDSVNLSLEVNIPAVNIERRTGERAAIRLPQLEYEFQISYRCEAGNKPKSLLLSIADSRRRLTETDLAAATATLLLAVPAGQIAPLVINEFCIADVVDDASPSITVNDALSVQASLLCVGEEGENMTYASTGLAVTLNCEFEELLPDGSADQSATGDM